MTRTTLRIWVADIEDREQFIFLRQKEDARWQVTRNARRVCFQRAWPFFWRCYYVRMEKLNVPLPAES